MSGSASPVPGAGPPGVVVFDYGAWSALYPTLAANVDTAQAQGYFDLACLYLDNTPASTVRDLNGRAALLGLLVAHLASLALPQSQGGAGGLVGRVSEATRGSVSVKTEFATLSERAAWFGQTQYGASFWAATRGLRQARYVPGLPQRPAIWP
ncbi:DUF4054 domain-containing protein [Acetobacter sp. TBRC 12305]|uniref:DUF4054 domain-containing protein n=1 Tax=Acetobacter garciniae TaxID=2817435 RepID=A0A939HKF0_9PROT|nr:DUF4054 domain-containing protein [Acetobacter garciniae]MBO1326053.1 DUF4054 domain-containing protein [Acetobacter garciniae]MBX0345203.1 DUF4054 domain-containing protein [Acetobacter garciniae]